MLSIQFAYGGTSLFLLRIALAAIMIVHGWPKIKDLKKNAENFNGMGFRPGMLFGTIAAFLEFFGGLLILVGLFVHFVAAFFIIQFAIIIVWKISKGMHLNGGWELDLAILAGFIVLFVLGGGAYSLDRLFLIGL
jgi:putative oxidoreductase